MDSEKTNRLSAFIQDRTIRTFHGNQNAILRLIRNLPGDGTTRKERFPKLLVLLHRRQTRFDNSRCFSNCFFGSKPIYFLEGGVGILNDAFKIGDKDSILRPVNAELELL